MAVNEKLGKDPGSAARRRNRGTTHPWRETGRGDIFHIRHSWKVTALDRCRMMPMHVGWDKTQPRLSTDGIRSTDAVYILQISYIS